MRKINVEQIVTIYIHKKRINTNYQYYDERKFLFWRWNEGFYYLNPMSMSNTEILTPIEIIKHKGGIIEDKEVYFKPYINIYLSNSSSIQKNFETEDELDVFMNSKEMKGIKFIDN